MPLTDAEGEQAVRLARESLEAHVLDRPAPGGLRLPRVFGEKRGVFVTLQTVRRGERLLRGCVGYSEPVKPLAEAIRDVAVYASEDRRFPRPVAPEELDSIAVEVSVLTLPTPLEAEPRGEMPSRIRLGTDGLIVARGSAIGVFLPQVATEQGWDRETYLSEACVKAGLPDGAWRDRGTSVGAFQADVFGERSPRGDISRMGTVPSK